MKNEKGFIEVAALFGISIILLLVGVITYNAVQDKPRTLTFAPASPSQNLGTVTPASPNFPTSLNNFQDGDTINSGDWNAIESYLGIRNSSASNSLTYLLTNSASVDPGLKISTASISSTIAIAQGGTGSSTAAGARANLGLSPVPVTSGGTGLTTLTQSNLLVGNGSASTTFIAPGAAGSILQSTGSVWNSATFTAANMLAQSTSTVSNLNISDGVTSTIRTVSIPAFNKNIVEFEMHAHSDNGVGTQLLTLDWSGTKIFDSQRYLSSVGTGVSNLDQIIHGRIIPLHSTSSQMIILTYRAITDSLSPASSTTQTLQTFSKTTSATTTMTLQYKPTGSADTFDSLFFDAIQYPVINP